MKYILLIALMSLFVSCSNDSDDTNPQNGDNNDNNNLPALEDPCVISGDEIAQIIGWEGYSDGRPNGINSENLKVCDYGANSGNLQITFRRYDDDVIERKGLEDAFKTELESPAENFTSIEVFDGLGDQAVYLQGVEGPNNVYFLKWRFGNHTEKSVRFISSQEFDSNEKLNQLKQIANKLEE